MYIYLVIGDSRITCQGRIVISEQTAEYRPAWQRIKPCPDDQSISTITVCPSTWVNREHFRPIRRTSGGVRNSQGYIIIPIRAGYVRRIPLAVIHRATRAIQRVTPEPTNAFPSKISHHPPTFTIMSSNCRTIMISSCRPEIVAEGEGDTEAEGL